MRAAEELQRLLENLEQRGTTVMDVIRNGRALEPWTLYPDDAGIFDRWTRSQFYYHAHAGSTHEAGHFHTVHLFPDRTVHLVGISMAPNGWPQALFTLNLWAVGDAPETVANLKRYVRRFHVDGRRAEPRAVEVGFGPVIPFVNLVFRAFRPTIEALQDAKAAALDDYRQRHPGVDPYEDRSLEILSRVEVDVRSLRDTSKRY